MVKSLTLVGNGKMALALAKGLCGIYALEVVGRSSDALEQFEKALGRPVQKTLYADALIEEKTVILCVKPANLAEIAPYLKGTARTVYSVLAGTPLAALSAICARNYCRAMPNLAAEVALSMTSLVGDPETRDEALALFGTIGSALWLSSEKELDIATALAGSGPAYLALIAEALADGAVREG
ncbi:MAG: pyrroline-5-carboxylate reductase dimerization domain-containing protein, partial [Campylobacterota bacterium]